MTRLKLLALHGYHGSAAVIRAQLDPLFGDVAELVTLDAPSRARGDFGWWHAVDDDSAPVVDDPGVAPRRKRYRGFDDSRDAVIAACTRDPVDGVVGFSQGAAFAALLVGVAELSLRCAIVISGFPSNDPAHAPLYARRERYALPSLHVIGRSDTIVAPALSHALAGRFDSPQIIEHTGGHVVPSSLDVRVRLRAFLAAT